MTRFKPKKPVPTPAYLVPLIQNITQACTAPELTALLENFHAPHHFERPEERSLATWYEVLNKFDDLLDIYVKQHDILPSIPKAASPLTSTDSPGVTTAQVGGRTVSLINAANVSSGGRTMRISGSRDPAVLIPRLEPLFRSGMSDRQGSQSSGGPRGDEATTTRSFSGPVSPGLIFLILKATYRLVKNASYDTKNVYCSMEQISALLGDSSTGIALLSLEILNTLLQRSPKLRSTRVPLPIGLTDRLRDLAQGWGGREKGLGLVDCCSSLKLDSLPADGHSFRIEFKHNSKSRLPEQESDVTMQAVGSSGNSKSSRKSSTLPNDSYATRSVVGDVTCIHVPDVRQLPGDEKWLVTDFIVRYKIPRSKAFTLLSAYRRAKAFGNGRPARLGVTCQQLLALTTLSQLQPTARPLTELLQKEQELIPDIITLAKADATEGLHDVPKSLRILAVRCLTAMSSERARLSQIISAAGVGSHHGIFSSLLRSEISAMLGPSSERDAIVTDDVTAPDSVLHVEDVAAEDGEKMETDSVASTPASSTMALDADGDVPREKTAKTAVIQTVQMAEALLGLVHSIAMTGGSSGAANLVASGTLGIVVPLLRDRNPSHARAVAQGIRAMQGIIEIIHSSTGSQAFRDHDGLALVAERIAIETLDGKPGTSDASHEEEDERLERLALQSRGESRQLYKDLLVHPMTIERALAHQAPSSSVASRGSLPHSKWALLRSLHQLFLHALGSGGNQVRDLVANTALPSALRQLLARPFHYGGGLFASAAMVATAIAHSEPTATGELVKAGIAKAVLKSVADGLPPYAEAIRCIPNALAAICLAPKARDDIVRASPLRPYVLRLATPFYSRALQGEDVPANIGGALDELMRHVEALRPSGNDAIIQFLTQAAAFVQLDISRLRDSSASDGSGNSGSSSPSKKIGGNTGSTEKPRSDKAGSDSTPSDFVLLERMKLAVAHNASRLAGFSQGSSEHQNAIVRKGGLQQMLQLRVAPAMASSKAYTRDTHPSSRSSPSPAYAIASLASSLRSFSSRHDTHVLEGLFEVIREDAAKVLRIASSLGNSWLPEEEKSKQLTLTLRTSNSKPTKESSGKKRTRSQSARAVDELADAGDSSEMKVDTGPSVQEPKRKVLICTKEIAKARADLRSALCVLRVDVVLLSNLSRGGPGSLAGAWDAAGGSAVTALIAAVERSARWHLAIVYSGLKCHTLTDGDLCTAQVTAAATPVLKSVSGAKYLEFVPVVATRLGITSVDSSEFSAASKNFQFLPEKDEAPRQELKGLAWAMETFVYASQKLYMSLGRGIIFSSRRHNRDPGRYASSARSLASTIGSLLALHLKAAESLWSRNVATMGDGKVSAAWDYIRRIIVEIQSTLFCESNRSTQGLILRFFLSAGGAEALQRACRPLSLLEGSRLKLEPGNGVDVHAYSQNKKRFESFLKSNQLSIAYTTLILGEMQRNRNLKAASKSRSGDINAAPAEADTDAVMTAIDAPEEGEDNVRPTLQSNGNMESHGKEANPLNVPSDDLVLPDAADVDFSGLLKQVTSISDTVLHFRKQAAVNRIAADAWGAVSNLLHLFSNCPGLLSSAPPLPIDPESSGTDWEPKDIQRSAQSVAIRLLLDVTREPAELLSACRPGESLTSDVVTIILSILRTSAELCNTPQEPDSAENRPDSEDIERPTTDGPPTPTSPNPQHVRQLTEMGFSEAHALEALRRTYPPGGIEYATEWILSHPEPDPSNAEPDSDDSSSDDDAQNESSGEVAVDDQPSGSGDAESGDTEMNTREMEENEAQNVTVGASGDNRGGNESDQNPSATQNEADESIAVAAPPAEQPKSAPDVEKDDRKQSSDSVQAKTKPDADGPLEIDADSAALLQRSIDLEMNELCSTISDIKGLKKPDRGFVLKMINSVVDSQWIKSEPVAKRKGETQRRLSKAKAVPVDRYKSSKKILFESLIPVAKAAIKHEVNDESSSHASFVAVEILSILQKDKCLSSEVRLEFAKVITSELRKFLTAPLSSGQSINSIVGIRASFVWAHYGGNRARQALKASGAADLAFRTLIEMSKSWKDLENTNTVDEEATRPIQHLSIKENIPTGDVAIPSLNSAVTGEAKPEESDTSSLLPLRKIQMQAVNCMSTCLLVLDAFVRYHARDSIVEHTTNSGSTKDANAMEVDEDNRNELPPLEEPGTPPSAVMDDIMRVFLSDKEDNSKMDIDAEPDDLVEQTSKLKSKAKEDRKKALESAMDELKTLTGSGERQRSVSFPLSELLHCCIKLMSSLGKYKVGDTIFALVQLICSLTADSRLAMQLMEEGGVDLLLALPQIESQGPRNNTKPIRSLVRTVLRHVVEDTTTLTEAMEADIRVLLDTSQSRGRQTVTMRSLVSSSSGMISRNLDCFTRALASCARTRGTSSGGPGATEHALQAAPERETRSIEEWMVESKKRPNIVCVIRSLTRLLVSKSDRVTESSQSSEEMVTNEDAQTGIASENGLAVFALSQLSELVELCPVVAAEFLQVASPSKTTRGSALDFIVQKLLPLPDRTLTAAGIPVNPALVGVWAQQEETADAARALVLAMFSKTANAYKPTVKALARAAAIESEHGEARGGALKSLSLCIIPNTKIRVLREMLESNLANSLAKSLRKLDMSRERNMDVTSSVLKALSLIGQTAIQLNRQGANVGEEDNLVPQSREVWATLREDVRNPLTGGFMVL